MPVEFEISEKLVYRLISEQFPHWSHLPIQKVEPGGCDNRTFRLGEHLLVRIPSAKIYENQIDKEQTWLPVLRQHLSLEIPSPVEKGKACTWFERPWSVFQWIEGMSVNDHDLTQTQSNELAKSLAEFLVSLHLADSQNGPIAGKDNFFRGSHLSVYADDAYHSISQISDLKMRGQAESILSHACRSYWTSKPVWVHGDISTGNLLLRDFQLCAVIDFGCLGMGDPACDYMIAWTGMNQESRNIFRRISRVDDLTWARAKGWALWKAMQKSGPESKNRNVILKELFDGNNLN